MMREEIINFGETGYLCGILTPASINLLDNKICVIFLNAGLIHKVGPNCLYKKLAVKYSGNGFSCFRLDFSGLGDSPVFSGKVNNASGQISEAKMAMDWLQENKGMSQFLLAGICSGARAAWEVSLEDHRVLGLCLIDGIFADEQLLKEMHSRADRYLKIRYYKKHMFNINRWMKLLSGKSKLLNLNNKFTIRQLVVLIQKRVHILLKQIWTKLQKKTVINTGYDGNCHWDVLFERNVKIHLIFCEGGIAVDIFKWTLSEKLSKYKKNGKLLSTFVKDVDHTFTPVWSQDYLSDITTAWLKKEFTENLLK